MYGTISSVRLCTTSRHSYTVPIQDYYLRINDSLVLSSRLTCLTTRWSTYAEDGQADHDAPAAHEQSVHIEVEGHRYNVFAHTQALHEEK